MAYNRIIITIILLFLHVLSTHEESYNYKPNIESYRIFLEKTYNIKIPENVPIAHLKYMEKWAEYNCIPQRIMFRLVHRESAFDIKAKSIRSASGYMQVMPHNIEYYSKKFRLNKNSWRTNIIIGTTILREYYLYWFNWFNSDQLAWQYALASYNFGITNVIKYGIPTSGETYEFIKYILQ